MENEEKKKVKEKHKKYYIKNKEKIINQATEYYILNRKKMRKYRIQWAKKYYKKYPYKKTLRNIKYRCSNPKDRKYKYYGGKGIKCFLTLDQIKYLWERDRAFQMARPSIHRTNPVGNYTIENCQFIEMSKHKRNTR